MPKKYNSYFCATKFLCLLFFVFFCLCLPVLYMFRVSNTKLMAHVLEIDVVSTSGLILPYILAKPKRSLRPIFEDI